MSVRLSLAGRWLSPLVGRWILDRVNHATNAALDGLLAEYAPDELSRIRAREGHPPQRMGARRTRMAQAHARRVLALAAALGEKPGLELARARMYTVGVCLGRRARRVLGVGDRLEDLERAARILYQALGITFRLDRGPPVKLIVERCALARHYGSLTCQALSAVDEGVVTGLTPRLRMVFSDRLTDGHAGCVAEIRDVDEQ